MLINENTIEQACLRFLQELGWDYTHGSTINADGENPWRLRTDEVVFRSVLREAVERLSERFWQNVSQIPPLQAKNVSCSWWHY
ncbi:type I restriction endonuclease [Glaesserella parasuis]|uniref:type I restriction endonuclease n=1 Tax=Glaesserella parasuis TaxID=738 RepID=UPI00136D65F2|nr:type I restriction endonuclease [Glaesserella parasuis]MDG6303401.1 type I restriction endonuclease [Glaesserella parasuis]MDG6463214.1 type I restriction endonuclease [Glaesserella parasuis]MDG6467452.1 type I restriction endonuclease [Glaesserella parasuis]MDG6800128.1 type I restriction endonuclease [Glaesserella parasuis]MDG6823377.1 type I restriction endonuclease [Glaesserella parasuis]